MLMIPRAVTVAGLAACVVFTSRHSTAAEAVPAAVAGGSAATGAGVPLPAGWHRSASDSFGTGRGCTVRTLAELAARHQEAQWYNRAADGSVRIPNVVINNEQQTYVHFADCIAFATDHLTIQGRGHQDGTITSGELVSRWSARSFCVEATYRIPAADKSWPGVWVYAGTGGGDGSEFDVEQPVTPTQGVHHVSLHNHPTEGQPRILDPRFDPQWMIWYEPTFDASTGPHRYTILYDDAKKTLTRAIDGVVIYTTPFDWNASLGGTGHGPDPVAIVQLAVGGGWPGNLADPASYHGDLDLYVIDYYEPGTNSGSVVPAP